MAEEKDMLDKLAAQVAASAPKSAGAKSASASPVTSAPGKYRVKLKDNPEVVIDADDRLAAIQAYKRLCGVNSTIHEFTVEAV